MNLAELRHTYGSCFFITTPDGIKIPWKLLSIEDFQKYEVLLKGNDSALRAVIENEIFIKCVLDDVLVNNIDKQKAGTISMVVSAIMSCSGPATPEDFNNFLNINRQIASIPINEMVINICWAFPGYKPEDIYAMDYPTMMLRLAMAESKLIRTGIMTTPFTLVKEEEIKQEKPKKPKFDPEKLKEAWKEQNLNVPTKVGSAKNIVQKEQTDSNSFNPETHKIVTTGDMAFALDQDDGGMSNAMKEEAKTIYADYLDQVKDGKLRIKTYEERVAEAKERAANNARKFGK